MEENKKLTEESYKAKIMELADRLKEDVARRMDSTLKAVELSNYEDNYYLPKMAMCAILKDIERDYIPPRNTKVEKSVINNIYAFTRPQRLTEEERKKYGI